MGQADLDDLAIFFWDQNIAWTAFPVGTVLEDPSIHRVWKTTDSGKSWSASSPKPYPFGVYLTYPKEFFFLDSLTGWLRVSSGFTHMHDLSYLFQTSDGGQTWNLVNQPGNSEIEVLKNTAMAFANETDGWMLKDSLGGYYPFIEVTRDGGLKWEWVNLPAPEGDWEDLDRRCIGMDPVFLNTGEGLFLLNCLIYNPERKVYDPDQTISYLYRSLDLGETWEIQELPGPVNHLLFLNRWWGYALGTDHYRTRDGGRSWELVKTVNWQGQFSFISSREAWAIAQSGDNLALVHTSDSGETYQIITPVLIEGE
jgi:photosystem II stability/assembly factor-like uncharacterized protein